MKFTVIIADDHDIIRKGIKSVLEAHSEYKVIAEAKDGQEAKDLSSELKPDILLLDITMPKISGLDIIKQVHRLSPKTKIAVITVHKMGAYVLRALELGIKGYLNKDNVVEELIPALTLICKGGVYIGVQASEYLSWIVSRRTEKKSETLSKREMDILRLTAEGKTAKEVGETIFLSRRTIENYKNNILRKLNLHKTNELIKYAIENKIISIDNNPKS